jgi:hypothetical protein
VALAVIAVVVGAASLVSFGESYRGLYLWAAHHGLSGLWAYAWPLQVDTFIAVGELALFVALADRWSARSRVAAWVVTLAGLAVSVAGNIGHVTGHSLTDRLTAAVPPLAAAAALAVGLGVLKRVVEAHHVSGHKAATPAATGQPQSGQRPRQAPATKRAPVRSSEDIEAAALAALATNPAMTGAELAAAIGTSDRTARRVRARLAAPDN